MLDREKDLLQENKEELETPEVSESEHPLATEHSTESEGSPVNPDDQPEAGQELDYQALKANNAELRDKYIRLLAEFENYKKRTMRERVEFISTAAQATMSALMPVLDDFDRAKQNAESEASTEVFSDGVSLVYQKLYNTLKQRGLEPMESNGVDFDPELHEAVTEIPAPSPDMAGKVIDTIEKGYSLNGKIIRHAKVVVGK